MRWVKILLRSVLILTVAMSLSSCDPQVYGSVGVSSWGGSGGHYGGNSRMRGSISVGGRIR